MKKNLLIITQKVDKNDPVLGFFHTWLFEFSKKIEKINVICLEKGEYNLSENVKVFSLGKEKGFSKIKYIVNFYKLIWKLRKDYKTVFVHMNQEYVLLAGIFWRVFNKKILMWRNHPKGNLLTKIAVVLSNKVYCTSKNSFTNKFKKTKIMPVGIQKNNTEINLNRIENSILSLGRISPVKNIEIIISAFRMVKEKLPKSILSVVGNPTNRKIDEEYYQMLKKESFDIDKNILNFKEGVSPENTKEYFTKYEIFVNATTPGSFDKTILESMSYGTPAIVCQDIWQDSEFAYLSKYFYFPYKDVKILSEKIYDFLTLSKDEKERIKKDCVSFVLKYHSLGSLVDEILLDI